MNTHETKTVESKIIAKSHDWKVQEDQLSAAKGEVSRATRLRAQTPRMEKESSSRQIQQGKEARNCED